MQEITTNIANYSQVQQKVPQETQAVPYARKSVGADEFYRREKRKHSGLVEKLYNKIKNITGLGVGTKRVEAEVQKAKDGSISPGELKQTIQKYQASQENSAQLAGDAVSTLAAGATFFYANKYAKYTDGYIGVNKPVFDKLKEEIDKTEKEVLNSKEASLKQKNFIKKISSATRTTLKTLTSNKKMLAISTLSAAYMGGLAKYWFMKFNRAGSDEFKVDENIYGSKKHRNAYQKRLAKSEKKRLNKERRKANFRNFISGAVNGLMTPLMTLGGIVAAPVYLVGNSLNRYFIANRTDKNKSVSGYVSNLSNDALATGVVAAGIAVPLVKKSNFVKTFNENISKAKNKLASASLKAPDYKSKTAYQKLEDMLLSSKEINSIISGHAKVEDKITQLTKENIFAVKFKQISKDGSTLTNALREKCPPTRTIEEAQKYITKNAGSGYEVKKLLGVGTVAETYLAKDKSGKDVCIKILKDGISKDKILEDKKKFVDMLNKKTDISQDEKDYLLRNLNDLAEGILKEVDLKNEMDAALRLAKSTHVAHVVKPIDVKNNVYIMEKANGVSLSSFISLNHLYIEKEALQKLHKDAPDYKKRLQVIEDKIKEVQSRMPDFDNITLRKQDTSYLLDEYQKVFVEQFHKIDKDGKVIHADIHPGNIFIDPNALRTRKGKLFTLIDTGNTIDMGVEQSMRALNLTKYIKQGNVQDIAEYVIDGAKLPQGMSKEEALKNITKELKLCFFDDKTKLERLNDEKILGLTDQIMQKYNIIPASTQLNLNKSRKSAMNSLAELKDSINAFERIEIFGHKSTAGVLVAGSTTELKNLARNKAYENKIAKQEKENLKQLSLSEQFKQKTNPNAPKENSEDYLTYWLKQRMIDVGELK